MHRFILLATTFFAFSISSFSQIDELKKAQDVRKTYINTPESQQKDKLQFVNPFIGTGGHGHTYPGATAPFGMIQVSPDTRYEGWDGCSGYHYSDSVIYGFSLTHLSGVGVPDLCDVLLVPQVGELKTTPGYLDQNGYGAPFMHANEKASPGFYSVKLDNQIDVRVTASERAGVLEFTFNASGKKYILIDLDHRDEVLEASAKTIEKNAVSGYRHSSAWAKNQKLFFYLETSIPFSKSTWITINKQHKLVLEFPADTKKVTVTTAISAVDEAGAKKNHDAEIPVFPKNNDSKLFDAVFAQTVSNWKKELNKIDFYSPENEVMINFYTALYHTCLSPTLFTDVDHRYLGHDGKIQLTDTLHPQYSVFSLWDTYRAAHPLYTIAQRKRTEDFIHSFLRIYDQRGDLPMWELLGNETDCMIGYHSVSVILDAYRKGIRNFDAQKALSAMKTTANLDELGKLQYEKNGFLSTDVEPESVSKTLEYAYDDWCIAQFALELKDEKTYQTFSKRAYSFLNVYDPQTKFMRARRSAQWFSPFAPSEVNFNYTEANSWQYSLAAPQHIGVLRNALGGKDSLECWLDRLFSTQSVLEGRHQVDITGLIGQYAHGNEPSHHMAYLYNYTNNPSKTQTRIDEILRTMYSPTPEGLSGNEDCGQMSAWYVLSALGFYPVTPGKTSYAIGRPLQESATIQLENGEKFTIRTENNSPENKYIQFMTLNKVRYPYLILDHSEIIRGGELVIHMSNQPNSVSFAYDYVTEPLETNPIKGFVAVPYFSTSSRTFTDSLVFQIHSFGEAIDTAFEFSLRYTTDGSDPDWNSALFENQLVLKESTVVKAKTFKQSKANPNERYVSPTVETHFKKSANNASLRLETSFANQYAAAGNLALIDGLRGGDDFRSGDWQGYEGEDVVGEIQFTTPQLIRKVNIGCLQDQRSWIFIPTKFEIEFSQDGINFTPGGSISNQISPTQEGSFSHTLTFNFNTKIQVKAIRFRAVNRKTNPAGHISAGEKSWVFVDEVWWE